jgi:hypothetical protein
MTIFFELLVAHMILGFALLGIAEAGIHYYLKLNYGDYV